MDKYLEHQRDLINKLRERGIYFGYKDRLGLFELRTIIPSLHPDDPWRFEVLEMIDDLVAFRREGLEPKHENGQYS